VRVRLFGLRLIAATLSALWTLAAALVLLGYRPGGPFDLLVGLAAAGPVLIGLAALAWPPVARGDRAFSGIVWLGLAAALVLVPSIGGIVAQLTGRGFQTLLPSLEAAYPWLLALAATSLFAGLGIARRALGDTSLRRRRLVGGLLIATGLTATAGSLFTGVAVANELALRDRPAIASRFGPTQAGDPPGCEAPLAAGPGALVELIIKGDVDQRPLGSVEVRGIRAGDNFRWTAAVATTRALGQYAAARIGTDAWRRDPGSPWRRVPLTEVADAALDVQVLAAALGSDDRAVAEMHGIAFLEGARARHCRIAVDGDTFAAAFPQARWLIGEEDIGRWRGELDFWVFADGQLGQVVASVNGEAVELAPAGLLATVTATLTATDRDRDLRVPEPSR
jgi:hypothetical protein